MVTVAYLASMPFGAVAYLVHSPGLAMTCFVPSVLAANFWQATTLAQAQTLVRVRMRAMASAVLLLIANIIGLGVGPWAMGALSDALAPRFGAESLRYSLLSFGLLGLWVAWHFWQAGKHLPGDLARSEHATAG